MKNPYLFGIIGGALLLSGGVAGIVYHIESKYKPAIIPATPAVTQERHVVDDTPPVLDSNGCNTGMPAEILAECDKQVYNSNMIRECIERYSD